MHVRTHATRLAALAVTTTALLGATLAPVQADDSPPDLIPALSGYEKLWHSDGRNDLHGTVLDGPTLARDDQLVTWINRHATKPQQFRALQQAEYDDGDSYDQSLTIADGLGSRLGRYYVEGRLSGKLPRTSALVNSENGSTGAFVGTDAAKKHFSHPRPYVPVDADAAPVPGDAAGCAPSVVNASSLKQNRVGRPWADADGNLRIKRVPDAVDRTHRYADHDVRVSGDYGTTGLCTGGSFPSGHTTTAYQAGITLATLLPEKAPEILTSASEAANNRMVLGVHYPLDIVGGRIDGELSLATRWSDAGFRARTLTPARRELVRYLERRCGTSIARCAAHQRPYTSNPYGGQRIPGGTAQVVRDRRSATKVYRERMSYGFAPTSSTHRRPSVPRGAQNVLRTVFPQLSDEQRREVLEQTEIRSGHPLDTSGTRQGSWQRIDLAAAFSATVRVDRRGHVHVVGTGGKAGVVRDHHRR